MNFYAMWSVDYNTDILFALHYEFPLNTRLTIRAHRFWKIAIPVMALVIPLFTWPDMKRAAHYAEKRWATRRPMMVRAACFIMRFGP